MIRLHLPRLSTEELEERIAFLGRALTVLKWGRWIFFLSILAFSFLLYCVITRREWYTIFLIQVSLTGISLGITMACDFIATHCRWIPEESNSSLEGEE
jgi:hypothetical protein